ncbi:M20/M25/M40 family metallo-hydrolase [Pseudooceanicola sp. CBS1P-1]|uniref:M20/M25/M40 family metallo-hydrolase n=1 Tax=Pseudooceanicola albus TaxID=2692189 RepID=A0A6L7G585_9RHOB|nr:MULTISPECIES: M20/M25/M40 family metallo-hydrolase [Pseudooceanicola]MBT9385188.1 M20/M25/M40 family metallo-hydrolase [Pseudooceanicola endophyticus]MXN18520.1 M20/M25/M40 family metallo-hydrolase [Pseudooceanicola albus]
MTAPLDTVLARADANLPSSLDTLFGLLRIPSVSTDPAHAGDCREAAGALAAYLETLGLAATVRETAGHPVVLARLDGPEGAPHVLFYGHYDVQPVDPLALWTRDPFDPAILTEASGRKIIAARGASDDKGQLMTFVEALRAWREAAGGLPIGVTLLLEGEEECGSVSLPAFLEENKAELQADFAVICDTGMWDAETPSITTSLRGLVGEEVVIRAADRDLHSGGFGGAAANPLHILSAILADLRNADGRITLPGFYDGVEEVPEELKAQWAALSEGRDPLGAVGLSQLSGEVGRSHLELVWARPTAEVNGIAGGYAGAGFKTVIPAEATAKVSFRLVGHQDPEKIRAAFRAHVRDRLPADCSASFADHGGAIAVQMPWDWPVYDGVKAALAQEWPQPPVLVGGGGSIPIVADFRATLGLDSLMVGFSLGDDRVHSPNEKYNLGSFEGGIRSWVRIIAALAE